MKKFENFNLQNLNWFGISCIAKEFLIIENEIELENFLLNLNSKEKIFILGAGSNVLFDDNGFDGIVIKLAGEFCKISIEENFLKAGCGILSKQIAKFGAENSLSECEFLFTIPGTLGGNIRMNAGCYGSEIKDILYSVKYMDFQGKIFEKLRNEIEFSHRKTNLPRNIIFLDAKLKITKSNKDEILQKMQEMNQKRIETQPIGIKTCGSTFKNPNNCEFKAWQLIDMVGLRGYAIGGAKFAEKHCNFIVIEKNAKSSDIRQLCELAKEKIFEKFAIYLEPEIEFIT